jgi:hypothetical protein
MIGVNWRESLPEDVRESLEEILESTESWGESFSTADNPGAAQLWTAVALLHRRNKRLEDLVMRQRSAIKELGADLEEGLDEEVSDTLKNY